MVVSKASGRVTSEGVDTTVQGVAADACEGQAGESATRQKRRGHGPERRAGPITTNPLFAKKFKATMCGNCGRADLQPYEQVWKTVVDNTECDERICHTETAIPGGAAPFTHHDKDSIPGAACGPRLRRTISNMHEVTPSTGDIKILLFANHNRVLSTGCISNCISAMAKHALDGNRSDISERYPVAPGGGTPIIQGRHP